MSLISQLNIDVAAGPGRPSKPIEFAVVREMTAADVEMLSQSAGSVAPPLKRITDRHHSLARLLASGVSEGEAALILNLSNSRVSIIKDSPAFVELLALYRKEVNEQFATNLEHMAGLSRDAILELRERLEDNPEKFSIRELLSVVTDMQDRAGDGERATDLPTKIELVAKLLDEDADGTDSASA